MKIIVERKKPRTFILDRWRWQLNADKTYTFYRMNGTAATRSRAIKKALSHAPITVTVEEK